MGRRGAIVPWELRRVRGQVMVNASDVVSALRQVAHTAPTWEQAFDLDLLADCLEADTR